MIDKIEIEMKDYLKILIDLEYMVVSFDRIGSSGLPSELFGSEIERFVVDGGVFGRLVSMRKTLADALDCSASVLDIEIIEDRLGKITPWAIKGG